MAKIEYIPIQLRYLEALQFAKPEQVGGAVVSALRYAKDGEMPDASDSDSALLFWMLKGDIDRVQESLEEASERQRENANKRWQSENATACHGMPRDATAYDGMPLDATATINKKNQKKESKKTNSKMEIPTVEEVRAECEARGFRSVDPEYFVNYYNGTNWMVSGSPMYDWKAILWTWDARDRKAATKRQADAPAEKSAAEDPGSSYDTDEFFGASVKAAYKKYGFEADETEES